jgi:hypothetical protein
MGGEERWVDCVGGKTKRKEIHLEDLDVDGRLILKWI